MRHRFSDGRDQRAHQFNFPSIQAPVKPIPGVRIGNIDIEFNSRVAQIGDLGSAFAIGLWICFSGFFVETTVEFGVNIPGIFILAAVTHPPGNTRNNDR